MRFGCFLVLLLAMVVFTDAGYAQSVPDANQPGVQAERFRRDTLEKKDQLLWEGTGPLIVEEEEKAGKAAGPSFVLKDIRIAGGGSVPEKDLRAVFSPRLNTSVTFEDIRGIIKGLEDVYAAKGYMTTKIFMLDQDIVDGVVTLTVSEGLLGAVTVQGNRWFSTPLIRSQINARAGEILDIFGLQRDVLRLNQNSDLDVKMALSAGEKEKTSDLRLNVEDRAPYHFGFTRDNTGTRLTGKDRTGLSFRSSNFLGRNDDLSLNLIRSKGAFGQSLGYRIPLNTRGTYFGLDAAYYTMKLRKELANSQITGKTHAVTPSITQELYLTEKTEVNATVGLEVKRTKRKQDGDVINEDKMSLPYLAMKATYIDGLRGQTMLRPKVVFGTKGFLDASDKDAPLNSRAGTGGEFVKYEQTVQRIQVMPRDSLLFLTCVYQAATRALPSSEQMQIGGADSVRGYPEGDFLADTGVIANIEMEFPFFGVPEEWKVPFAGKEWRETVKPVVFFDCGMGRLKKISDGQDDDKILLGAGGGFKVRVVDGTYLKLEWAKALGQDPVAGSGESTFHFSFQAEF